MKALLASICSIFAASAAGAASVTVPDNSTSLAGVAAATTALLLDAGLKPQNAGGGVFVLDAKNFHCDQHLNGALDGSSVLVRQAGSGRRFALAGIAVNPLSTNGGHD